MLRTVTRAGARPTARRALRRHRGVRHRPTAARAHPHADLGGDEPLTHPFDPDANRMPRGLVLLYRPEPGLTFRDRAGGDLDEAGAVGVQQAEVDAAVALHRQWSVVDAPVGQADPGRQRDGRGAHRHRLGSGSLPRRPMSRVLSRPGGPLPRAPGR